MSTIQKRLLEDFSDKEYAHAYMDMHLIDRISTQIYQLREQRGWTQQQLEKFSGIAQERISKLEAGDFTSITMKTLRRLAEAFDVALTIKFESFAEAIEDFVSLSKEKLQVPSREESLETAKLSHSKKMLPASNALNDMPVFPFDEHRLHGSYKRNLGNHTLVYPSQIWPTLSQDDVEVSLIKTPNAEGAIIVIGRRTIEGSMPLVSSWMPHINLIKSLENDYDEY